MFSGYHGASGVWTTRKPLQEIGREKARVNSEAEKANIEAVKCAQIAQQVAEKKEDCGLAVGSRGLLFGRGPLREASAQLPSGDPLFCLCWEKVLIFAASW